LRIVSNVRDIGWPCACGLSCQALRKRSGLLKHGDDAGMPGGLKAVGLPNRGVVKVAGEEARPFLDNLITNGMDAVGIGTGIHAALLTPQGKMITDFCLTEASDEDGGGFYCDVPLVAAAELAKRLTFYRLRAKIAVEDLSETLGVVAAWGGAVETDSLALAFVDPRLPGLGLRVIAHKSQTDPLIAELGQPAALEDYHAHRAQLGIGEVAFDFVLGDAFPHEINMDQLHGIDFRKGCYVGQEVVSRMQHRGTARTRLIQLRYHEGFVASAGAPVLAGEKMLGSTGTAAGGVGLAMIRLDRAAEAMAAGIPILAGGLEASVIKPAWWTADWPLP
jgi:tRNA-modifying protein YgfZ